MDICQPILFKNFLRQTSARVIQQVEHLKTTSLTIDFRLSPSSSSCVSYLSFEFFVSPVALPSYRQQKSHCCVF